MDTFNDILFWIFLFLLVWQAYILLFNGGIPSIKTAPAIRKKIIELIKEDIKERGLKTYTVFDLGSSSGSMTRDIARAIPEAHVVGLELSKAACFIANLHKKRTGLKNIEYRQGDFFETSWHEADAVTMFLLDTLMPQIRKKLETELKSRSLVISNKFKIYGDWTPIKSIDVKTIYPHQKTLHIYCAK